MNDIKKDIPYFNDKDVYDPEVDGLINDGGVDRLKNQYKIVSSRLDSVSAKNRELQKRIDELESEKTENCNKINLNDNIKVKLTPLGAEIFYHQNDDVIKEYPKMEKHLPRRMPRIDKDGYTEFQLWNFIELYGGYIGMGKANVIDPIDLVIL